MKSVVSLDGLGSLTTAMDWFKESYFQGSQWPCPCRRGSFVNWSLTNDRFRSYEYADQTARAARTMGADTQLFLQQVLFTWLQRKGIRSFCGDAEKIFRYARSASCERTSRIGMGGWLKKWNRVLYWW